MSFRFSLALLLLSGYLSITSKPLQAEVLFNGDWINFRAADAIEPYTWLNTSNGSAGRWQTIQANDLSRLIVEKDASSPNGNSVAHIFVLSGDNLNHPGGERAEVSRMIRFDPTLKKSVHFDVHSDTGHEFYAISVKVPLGWKGPGRSEGKGPIWGIIMQLHSPDVLNSPPALALALEDSFHLNLCSGQFLVNGKRKDSVPYAFKVGTDGLNPGHWVQFVLEITWATENNGAVTIFRRDEGQSKWTTTLSLTNIPTLQYGVSPEELPQIEIKSPHYWKTGYYRSATAGLKSELWLGPLVRGTTFDDVAKTAFGQP